MRPKIYVQRMKRKKRVVKAWPLVLASHIQLSRDFCSFIAKIRFGITVA
jgi:hypothetical protein